MEASEPKSVNPVLKTIEVNSHRLGCFQKESSFEYSINIENNIHQTYRKKLNLTLLVLYSTFN